MAAKQNCTTDLWNLGVATLSGFLLVVASGCLSLSYTQEEMPAETDSTIHRIIILTITQKYDSAFTACERLKSLPGGLPYGYFFEAAILQSRMLDYENDVGEEEFFAAARRARHLFQKQSREKPGSAISHFFIGAAHGYEAFYHGKRGRLLEGFHSGWQCLQELRAALALDPELYDAYLGIGTFRYYQARLGRHFAWLPFVEDNREQAIGMIRKAIRFGKYARHAAMNGISWILMEEGRPEEALALADSALAEFPRSRFFLWGAAEANFRLRRWSEAARNYKLILELFAEEKHPSPYNELVCSLRLAEIYFHQAHYDACRQQLVDLFALPGQKDVGERGRRILKQARELEKQVEKL